jgi:hypothetical protein
VAAATKQYDNEERWWVSSADHAAVIAAFCLSELLR